MKNMKIADLKMFFHKAKTIMIGRLINPFVKPWLDTKWKIATSNKSFIGTANNTRHESIIVSLTSFPGRINVVSQTIKSLLLQSLKPDRIILWLADEQFKGKLLPTELENLCQYGLEIKWYHDIRSYKKLIPTLQEKDTENSIIITTDDDLYYSSRLIETLYDTHLKFKNDIICHRATKIVFSDGEYTSFPGGYEYYENSSYLNKLVGCSGVLYPINAFHSDVTNESLFMNLAPTNDDIWFWAMGVLKGTKVRVVHNNNPYEHHVKGTQKGEQLSLINDHGDMLFWKQFNNLISYYPLFAARLADEMKGINK